MAAEVVALLETMRLRREAEARLRQEPAPCRRPRGGSLRVLVLPIIRGETNFFANEGAARFVVYGKPLPAPE